MKIIINEYEKEFTFEINPEQPFLKIKKIEVPELLISDNINFTYTLYSNHGGTSSMSIDNEVIDEIIPNIKGAKMLKIKASTNSKITMMNNIIVYYENIELYSISSTFKDFNDFISINANTKIMFSAPFGHGKSTFLDLFFENSFEEYNVFKVYPVNYSVSSNKDIFRYVKVDLLLQLLNNENSFIKTSSVSYQHAAYDVITESKGEVIKNFIKLCLSINPKTAFLKDSITPLYKTISKIIERKNGNEDEKMVDKYFNEISNEEGSLYDDNLYTQLIKLFLEQIKLSTNKKSVLVIEDLDRIDPEHVFRILNIISAHFDKKIHDGFNNYNKFGFDKIIIVCDINNIHEIFKHKYGVKSDFNGYINKYYSTKPFEFDNNKMFDNFIDKIISPNSRINKEEWMKPIRIIFKILMDGRQISARDFIKILCFNFEESIDEIRSKTGVEYHSNQGLIQPIINFLLNIFPNDFISKIEICKEKEITILKHYLQKTCENLIIPLGKKYSNGEQHNNYFYNLEENIIYYNTDNNIYTRGLYVSSIETSKGTDYVFTMNDFYSLFIENIKSVLKIKYNLR